MPTASGPPNQPWWKRWPAAAAAGVALVLVGVIVGSSAGSKVGDDGAGGPSDSVATTAAERTTTTRPPTTTTTISTDELYQQMQQEIEGSCIESYTSGTPPMPDFDEAWSELSDPAKLAAAAQSCVDQKNQADIDGAQPVSVDEIIKDPDAVTGRTFVMVVNITQFDAATGSCSFRGYWDNTQHSYNYEYAGDNAIFTSGDGYSTCPLLDGIDQNDTIKVWAKSTGSISYDTQIGGNTTAPSFNVLRAEVLEKA